MIRINPVVNNPQEGYEEDLNPNTQALEAGGLYVQNTTSDDSTVFVGRDSSDNLTLTDPNVGTKTLANLVSVSEHPVLRQLIHLSDESGPFEGFASGAFLETLYSGAFPTDKIWWTSAAKTGKIVEQTVTYNGNKTIATSVWKVYDTDGTTVLKTVTDTISYSGVAETSRTRTIA